VDIFLAELPAQIEQIREAIAGNDAAALRRAAHTLKGAVGTFSAQPVFEAAQEMEMAGNDGDLSTAESNFAILEQEIFRLRSALLSWREKGTP
jgi:HPt (histidine-containing phosphotransfer) domain-containing protein